MADKYEKRIQEPELIGFVGIGLDNHDAEVRLTHSEHFLLLGGSHETHEQMQETVIRFDEALKDRGQSLRETPLEVLMALLAESGR